MPRFPKGVQGPSEDEATKRFGEAVEHADGALRLASELSARVEKARAGSLGRERGRLVRKYGPDSPQARRAEALVRAQERVLETAVAAAQRARVPVTPLDDETTRVHGRVVDRRRAGIVGVEARLLDAQGKTLAKAATDENGYFRLDAKPRSKPGPAKTAGGSARRIVAPDPAKAAAEDASGASESAAVSAAASTTWELVLLRGHQELFREPIRDVEPGQAIYREPMLDTQ